jgi:hypothetical protein
MTTTRKYATALVLMLVGIFGFAFPVAAQAGSYVVAQCSPGLFQAAPDAGYGTNSDHFSPIQDCGTNGEGLQIGHVLVGTATGTEQNRFGAFVFQAASGTCISGGTVYSRFATENGIHGYLAVSPDAGASVVTQNQNDDQLHLSAIPGGCWRFLVERLECTAPNEGSRCVGPTPNAHARIKQIFIQITDVSSPTLAIGGSMFAVAGGTVRGQQTVSVNAADQGAGLRAVSVTVNGSPAAGDDLSASCNPLPENLTSRMAPCPPTFSKTYTLNTEAAPFKDGVNTVSVCAADYATAGTPNTVCENREITVDALCPASPRSGGAAVTAGFGNGKANRVLPYGKKALLRGRVLDGAGNGVEGAQVCVEGHMLLSGRTFRLLGTPTTNQAGGWEFKLNRGASRELLVAYRANGQQVETTHLLLHVRAHAALHVNKLVTRDQKRVVFSGSIPGPSASERVVILKGSVPGARRSFLVRRARTDALGNYRMFYRFSPVGAPTKFVFRTLVPQQSGYPYIQGRSPRHFVKVRPCGRACEKRHHHHKHKHHHHKQHSHKQHH